MWSCLWDCNLVTSPSSPIVTREQGLMLTWWDVPFKGCSNKESLPPEQKCPKSPVWLVGQGLSSRPKPQPHSIPQRERLVLNSDKGPQGEIGSVSPPGDMSAMPGLWWAALRELLSPSTTPSSKTTTPRPLQSFIRLCQWGTINNGGILSKHKDLGWKMWMLLWNGFINGVCQ